MLRENQLKLLRHLARFNLLAYEDCLAMLDAEGAGDRTALSYVFRPLTKHGYVSKREDGCVPILAKGKRLFPEITPIIATGGGAAERRRVMGVSRMAALMEKSGVPVFGERQEKKEPYFIPSTCWRNIAPGILSTTRFTGMVLAGKQRLAVYDIGDGHMEWQAKAESSLFYTKYGSYETKATGMIFVCREDMREQVAQNIIRQTMWYRRQALQESCLERNKPTRWSHAPIRLKAQYEHAYLTTPERLSESLQKIFSEDDYIQALCDDVSGTLSGSQGIGDIEAHPRRLFVNPACDLLKYVRFFSAVRTYLVPKKEEIYYRSKITLEIYIYPEDRSIVGMYPEMQGWEGLSMRIKSRNGTGKEQQPSG